MKNTFYNLLIITSILFGCISCDNNEVDIQKNLTVQESLIGIWQVDSAASDINTWKFEEDEVFVNFTKDSVMSFINNGDEISLPTVDRIYHIEKLCDLNDDKSCPLNERFDVLVVIGNAKRFNTIRFKNNFNYLAFGQQYVDGIDYYCTRVK
jgi:hypothetical protein